VVSELGEPAHAAADDQRCLRPLGELEELPSIPTSTGLSTDIGHLSVRTPAAL